MAVSGQQEFDLDTLIDEQRRLEEESVSIGQARVREQVQRLRENRREHEGAPGRQLMAWAVPKLSDAIAEWIEKATNGKPTPNATAARLVRDQDPDVLAYLTMRAIVSNSSQVVRLQTVALEAARLIEDETRFQAMKRQDPKYFKRLAESLKKRSPHYAHGRRVFLTMASRQDHIEMPEPWPQGICLRLGVHLVSQAVEVTGLFETSQLGHKAKNRASSHVVQPTQQLLDWLRKGYERLEMQRPKSLPCVIPPARWESPFKGGYHFALAGKFPLVKQQDRAYLEDLETADMQEVYDAVNNLQETPWAINEGVLGVAQEAMRLGLEIPGLHTGMEDPLPARPPEADEDEDKHREWKRMAAAVYDRNIRKRSKATLTSTILWMAGRMKDYPRIYFPYTLDFRGRAYPAVPNLNPQGCDLSKGLLRFAEGKPLGEEGPFWLAVHVANTAGQDKMSLEERAAWVEQNHDRIIEAAIDPLGRGLNWWADADDPWQHLAACFEWLGYTIEGEDYVSRVPIAFDGSCNGLQHYSAMLRDREGGSAVNLIPMDQPADIYGEVLTKLQVKVERDAANSEDEKTQDMALRWLRSGELDRQMVKRPVMTIPYGSQLFGFRQQIQEELKDRNAIGMEGSCYWESAYLAERLWETAKEVVRGARRGMDWLQEMARLVAKEELPVTWTAPTGFPIKQQYRDTKYRRVETHWAGAVTKKRLGISLKEETDKLNSRRQANGIGPNVVHSLDAAMMMFTVNRATSHGIGTLSMVHDSYATTAADAGLLFGLIREVFVEMYREPVLEQLQEEFSAQLSPEAREKAPALPERGDLDIEEVLESDFFFS